MNPPHTKPCNEVRERLEEIETYAERLKAGEALAIPGVDVWIARTKQGALRLGHGWVSVRWLRGDWREPLAEYLTGALDPRRAGIFAERRRGELQTWLANPLAHRLLSRIGAVAVHCEKEGRSLREPIGAAHA